MAVAPRSVVPEQQQRSGASECRAEHMQYFMDLGLDRDTAALLYRAERLQEKGQLRQALPYFQEVLATNPDCIEASVSVKMITKLLKDTKEEIHIEPQPRQIPQDRRSTRKRLGRRERHALRSSPATAAVAHVCPQQLQNSCPTPAAKAVVARQPSETAVVAKHSSPRALMATNTDRKTESVTTTTPSSALASACRKSIPQPHELAMLRALHGATGEFCPSAPQDRAIAEGQQVMREQAPTIDLMDVVDGTDKDGAHWEASTVNALRCTLGAALGRSNVPFRDWAQLVNTGQEKDKTALSSLPAAVEQPIVAEVPQDGQVLV